MKLGSQAHKELFCRNFLDTYLDYDTESLPCPDLDPISLDRLRGIPFWREALYTERKAGLMVTAFAKTIEDPLLREAIALQGREESRHARLIQFLINHYGIEIQEPETAVLADNVEVEFITFGFEECLDSFFAFGLYEIAHQANYLPEAIFQIFNPILDEEARHIAFFVNWFTYLQIQKGLGLAPLRGITTLWYYGSALWGLVKTFGGVSDREDQGFTITGAGTFMDNLTPEQILTVCLQENEKRLRVFDAQLLQPRLFPRLGQWALTVLRRLPKRSVSSTLQQSSS
jgi:hypothetical protein